MKCLNKVTLIGYVGSYIDHNDANGKTYARFSLATSFNWQDKSSGEKKEAIEWHQIVAFDSLANIVKDLLKKGSLAYVEGRIEQSIYTEKDGTEKRYTQIIANEVILLSQKKDEGS